MKGRKSMNDLTERVINTLLDRKITIATAESCTGGLVAKTITDFSGVSEIFSEGYVTYSNDAKMKNLGVKAETLSTYGAVSAETAREMAEGVRKVSGASIGISTTGIAGPGGGTAKKPVGLVYIGASTKNTCLVRELHHTGTREEIRYKTVLDIFALIEEAAKGIK